MDQFDLIGALRTYATSKSWAFLFGENFMRDYEASKINYTPGQLILGADPFVAKPSITKAGKIDQITYQGLIMLGRKFESSGGETPTITTVSSLDETTIQKYDRRLKELMQTLSTNIISFACTNELEVKNLQFELRLNNLDENVDFIIASIELVQ